MAFKVPSVSIKRDNFLRKELKINIQRKLLKSSRPDAYDRLYQAEGY